MYLFILDFLFFSSFVLYKLKSIMLYPNSILFSSNFVYLILFFLLYVPFLISYIHYYWYDCWHFFLMFLFY